MTDGNLTSPADGSLPLDNPMLQIMVDPLFRAYLFPRQAERKREAIVQDSRPSKFQMVENSAKGKGKGKDKGKSKGKDKGKSKSRGQMRMPAGLHGMEPTINGERACFDFNLNKCSVTGNRCEKGVHKCMRPGCGGPHSANCKINHP